MENNIKRMPYKEDNQRRINTHKRRVPCQLSEKWLQFPDQSHIDPQGEFMSVDVMTSTTNDAQQEQEVKICELVLFREDLEAMLIACHPQCEC